MALDIGCERVGIALAAHSSVNKIIYPQKEIEYYGKTSIIEKNKPKDFVLAEIGKIVKEKEVCAFIVTWPLEPNRRFGKSCGRVLHILDQLSLSSSEPLLSHNRPFVLWEEGIVSASSDRVDKWGRSVIFSQIPSVHQKIYSSEMGNDSMNIGDSLAASNILADFMNTQCRDQGIDEVYHVHDSTSNEKTLSDHGFNGMIHEDILNDYQSNNSYIQSNIL